MRIETDTPAERRLRGLREFLGLITQEEAAAIDMGREALALLREWDRLSEWDGKAYSPEDELQVKVRALLARAGEDA